MSSITSFKRATIIVIALLLPLALRAQGLPPNSPMAGSSSSEFVWEDFELGTSYWDTTFEGSVMDGGTLSPDFPSHGKFGFRGHFLLPNGGGRAAFSTQQVGDLTGATSLTVDFYNSSPVTFNISVILKQGDQWTWHQSALQTILPGWNRNIHFDLSVLTPLSDIKQLALVFDSKQAGEGYLYMDYLRLKGADPEKVIHITSADLPVGSPVLITGFEDGTSPFSPEAIWSSARDVQVQAVNTTEGTHAGFFTFDNQQPDDKASYSLESDMDLSKATGLVMDVYNPKKDPVGAEIYLSTGSQYQYFESASKNLKPGWNLNVSFPLQANTFKSESSHWTNSVKVNGLSITRKLGLIFLPHQILKSYVMVDNIRLLSTDPVALEKIVRYAVPIQPPVTGTDHLLEGFEGPSTPWMADTTSMAVSAAIMAAHTTEGTHLLKADFNFDNSGKAAWYAYSGELDLHDASAVKVDIYNPNNSPLQTAMALSVGDQFQWYETKPIQLKKGWNKDVVFALKAPTFKSALSNWQFHDTVQDLNQVKKISIGFYSPAPLIGSVCLDNIRITGGQGINPKEVSQTPYRLSGRSVLWDPLLNFGGDGWLAQTSPGSNSFAVISEYKKFQGENVVNMKYRTFSDSQSAQFVKTEEMDWSNVLGVQFDFYNPQSYAVGFTLAFQTGPNTEWQESTEFTLKPGWNRNVRVDITQAIFKSLQTNWSGTDLLRTRDDIRTVIVNIYPHHSGDGKLTMANLRTIERNLVTPATGSEGLGKMLGISSETQVSARTLRYTLLDSFEGNISAWQPVAETLLSQSRSFPTDGTHSLKIDFESVYGGGPNVIDPTFEYNPPGGTIDMSPYSNVQFDVYNPGLPIEMTLAFYTGSPYNGNSHGQEIKSISVTVSSGWNRNLNIPLIGNYFNSAATAWKEWDTLRDASQTHQIQFLIAGVGGGTNPGRQTIYMDNVRLIGAGSLKSDGIASEQLGIKLNPSDAVQFVANGSVMGTGTNPAQFNLGKVRLDVRGGGDELALFTGDQLGSTDDPMTLLSGAVLGNQIFGVDDRYTLQGVGMVEGSGFAQFGATPESLGNTAGYLLRFKSVDLSDCWLGAGLLDSRYGNVPGSNPLTSNVEADIKTYEADLQGYLRDLRLGYHAEVMQSAYDAYPGSAYDLSGNNNGYYLELDYQFGPFKLQGNRLEHQENLFVPYSGVPYSGVDQDSGSFYWQLDTLPLVKGMQQWSPFWNNLLTGLNFQTQYYDYISKYDTYSNYGIRAILQNGTYTPPLYFLFWWYWYEEGQNAGDPNLPNPAISDRALITTSNYELHYQFTPKILLTGLFRDAFTDYWETFTYSGRFSWKFWGDTWATADYKYVNQTGSRFGQYNNFSAGFTKYLWQNTVTLNLTYGVPSFVDYWEDDNNLQTVDEWALSLTGKF